MDARFQQFDRAPGVADGFGEVIELFPSDDGRLVLLQVFGKHTAGAFSRIAGLLRPGPQPGCDLVAPHIAENS